MTEVREIQVFHWLLLAEHLEDHAGKPIRPSEAELSILGKLVDQFNHWFGVTRAPAFTPMLEPDSESEARTVFYPPPPAEVKWLKEAVGGLDCFVSGEIIHDVIVLRRAAGLHDNAGAAAKGVWNHFREAMGDIPEQLKRSHFFLGFMECSGGRVTDEAAALAAAAIALPGAPGPVRLVRLSSDGWLLDRPDRPDVLALFYPDTNEAERRAADYFNKLLPNVAIYRKKVELYYHRYYRGNLRARIRQQEIELALVLAKARKAADYEFLEEQLGDLAKAYDDYAAMLAVFKYLQNTVVINAANLTEILDSFALPQEGVPNVWRAEAKHAMDQLRADEGYFEARTREAEFTLRVLETRVDIERVKQENRQNKLSERRNLVLTILILLIGFFTLVFTLASDEVVKLLLDEWLDHGKEKKYTFWEMMLAKCIMMCFMIAATLLFAGMWWLVARLIRMIRGKNKGRRTRLKAKGRGETSFA